ncbi:hypothetical protein [Janthinobacterium lividum]|uniref:hypothetical protein n=1 Tax=Janthinobacterium lividum TaxID=29581 RepID=UPI000A4BA5E9|nr:hypothetical protein [Janthinobacterium lividum]
MSDFFYYGQKDTIQRLNELAGRGAVVASYAPAVGRSPLGGPNGYMDAAWIDTATPIKSQFPISVGAGMANKYGYNYLQGGQGQRLYKIATMLAPISSTYSSLRIDAMVGNWLGNELTAMTIVIGSRVSTGGVSVDWSSSRFIPVNVRFTAYQEADGSISVYLFFLAGAFAQASFQMIGMNVTTYESPTSVSSVTGTIVWDSSTNPGSSAYISPRSRGMGFNTTNGTSFDTLIEVRAQDGNSNTSSYLVGAVKQDITAAGVDNEVLRLGVPANAEINFSGFMQMNISAGNGSIFKQGYVFSMKARDTGSGTFSPTLFSVAGNGQVYVPTLKAGTASTAAYHEIVQAGVEGTDILQVTSSAAFRKCDNNWGNLANAAMIVQANSVTNRSSNNRGTVNTMGNDYAEYIFKSCICGIVTPGQLVGITAENKVTDQWSDAVMFSIKSTAPSFVGGDSWADNVGPRPSAQARAVPEQPLRREGVVTQQSVPGTNPPEYEDIVTEPGDTDDEWAEKQEAFAAALAIHNNAMQQDAEAMAAFDAALEVERQKVDRIAIAGRVPVNVLGAQPGDYIVPVQDGAGIKGIAVREDDLTMKQYLHAVGRVISIEPDGRAYVMVKAV